MKRIIKTTAFLLLAVCLLCVANTGKAAEKAWTGATLGGINISGMSREEINTMVYTYVDGMKDKSFTFHVAQGNTVNATLGDLGVYWSNPEVVDSIIMPATSASVIARYKMRKDIQVSGSDFPLEISFDEAKVDTFIKDECKRYDENMSAGGLKRENGEFIVEAGEAGQGVDFDESKAVIMNDLYSYYCEGNMDIDLPVSLQEPEASASELAMVKDLLGSYTTSFSSSGSNRSGNVTNGCSKIDGTVLYPGDEFSTYKTVSPFTSANGYYMAGSYMNGQVVESLGGGICQVSSTLYNAVLLAELEVVERNNHSMVVTYVPKSADAAIAESSGKDFRFINNTEHPIYIEGIIEDKNITFNIYGVETRPSTHKVEYVSEVLTETDPGEVLLGDASAAIGSFSTESKHMGYTARLWKVVYEDGKEVSRDIINNSKYSPSPKTIRVGVASDNPDYSARMQAAIATGDADVCRAVAGQIQAEQQQLLNLYLQQQQQSEATATTEVVTPDI